MYTRTHTHTQARTHTTKFSGHVVRFFFFRCFLFSSSPSVFRREENYLVHLFFTALVVHRNKHSHRTQSWRHSTDARTYAALLRHMTSTVRLRLNRDKFTTERPHFFFFTWSQGVWSWWRVVSHLRRLGPRNSATCVLLYHTSVSALYILLKECTTARTTSKHARTVNENNDGDGILHRDRMDNAYANAALEGTTLLDSSVFPPLTYNTRTWRQNVCT